MLFNSLDFAIFLPVVFVIYWLLPAKEIQKQNLFLVLASYTFYGWWDWRFLSLIFFSTVVDYSIGVGLSKQNDPNIRKGLLWLSIGVNLGFLGFFKYYNFFLDNFITAFSFFGMTMDTRALSIILPVGISFYTFQTLSYTIDVYRRKLSPTRDFLAFSAFVCFFPQLVAGPIERATHLLPQFLTRRTFNYPQAVDGLRQILWGLFKKIVIADNAAIIANEIFNNSDLYSGSTLLVGAVFFTFQIYGDFSGYSDVAIGASRLFGFDLKQNFAFPYFSRDVAEFWRRWHISLSTWFRDYVYIPLGGSRVGTWKKIRNTFIIFIVSGFWHGANWTFIIWGGLNAIYFLPLLLRNKNRVHTDTVAAGKYFPSLRECFAMLSTFGLTVLAWIFFRAENLSHAVDYLKTLFSESLFTVPYFAGGKEAVTTLLFILLFLLTEWFGRTQKYAIERLPGAWNRPVRWLFYYLVALSIYWFGGEQQTFIYFQF